MDLVAAMRDQVRTDPQPGGADRGRLFGARSDSRLKKWLGIVGIFLCIVALLFSIFLFYGMFRLFSAMGSG